MLKESNSNIIVEQAANSQVKEIYPTNSNTNTNTSPGVTDGTNLFHTREEKGGKVKHETKWEEGGVVSSTSEM